MGDLARIAVGARARAREEQGIALVLSLGMMIVLTVLVIGVVQFSSSNTSATAHSTHQTYAKHYAESGVDAAYSVLSQTMSTGGDPTAANLLGCSGVSGPTDTTPPSNCSSPTPKVYCLDGSSSCTAGSANTVSVYGFFSGTDATTFDGVSVPASSWVLVSTGYAWNPSSNAVVGTTLKTVVKVSALDSGAVAAVWNHVFITSPLTPGVCALSFGGNSVTVTAPLYVIGNLCLGSNGNGTIVEETTQPVDLQVGGKLVLLGNSQIGADSQHPITSGVVVGGCTTVSVSASTSDCSPTGFKYWVNKTDTFIPNDAPELTATDIANKYASADPGPTHPCASGGTLSSTAFDNNGVQDGSAPTFNLTPSTSYTCVSSSGSSVGQLSWNATTQQLTVQGTLFIDGNMTITQSATYTGTASLYTAGTITFTGNNQNLCATNPCDTTANAWQGSSSNKSMLTLASLASNTTSVTFSGNHETFQGSLWTQPSATVHFVQNSDKIEGPISVGSFDSSFNNATLLPMPVIKNMPTGAPLPPNSSASLGYPVYTG